MEVADLLGAIFNVILVVLIVSTMASAGFTTTLSNLGAVLSRASLLLLVLVAGFIVRPLVGWGTAELFGLKDRGMIAPGKRADLAVWNVEHPAELSYRIGFNPLHERIFAGAP